MKNDVEPKLKSWRERWDRRASVWFGSGEQSVGAQESSETVRLGTPFCQVPSTV